MLAVTATGREAEDLAAALRSLLAAGHGRGVPVLGDAPARAALAPRSDTVGRRLAVLRRLAHPRPDDPETGPVSVVVAPVRSVLQPQVKGLGDLEPVALSTGQTADLNEIVEALAAAAYARVELVEKRGEFAVRGGILDVFPPTEEHPLRVEFWGDDVEEIRYFKVADQRSLGDRRARPVGAALPRAAAHRGRTHDARAALAEAHPELGELLGKIAEGIAVEGMESLAPVLVDDMELLLDVLPKGAMAVVCDPERVRTRAADLVATSQEFLQASWAATAGRRRGPDRRRRGLPVGHRGRPGPGPRAGHDVVVGVAVRRRRGARRGHPQARHARPGDLPRRHRPGARRHQGLARRRLAHGVRHRGARPGRPHGRGARR